MQRLDVLVVLSIAVLASCGQTRGAGVPTAISAAPSDSADGARAHGVVTNAVTGSILPFLRLTAEATGAPMYRTVKTDSKGRYTLADLPLYATVVLKAPCPIPGRADSAHGSLAGTVIFLMTRPRMDTTLNVAIDYRECIHLDRAHPLIAPGRGARPGDFRAVPTEVASVYRGVLDVLHPPGEPETGPIVLEAFTETGCYYCIDAEVPRLVRKGLIDPSTEENFLKLVHDTAKPPAFSFRRKIEALSADDRRWLRGEDEHNWDAMKDAYPGARAVVSFSNVGFNDRGTEALVQVRTDWAPHADKAVFASSDSPIATYETMLLKKVGSEWRVALRNLEREELSAEWSGGKCEPTDAPAKPPAHADIVKLAGDFNVIRSGTTREIRGRIDTVRVRLEPLKPVAHKPNKMSAAGSVIGAGGKPDEKIDVRFEDSLGETPTITFGPRLPNGVLMFDGWHEEYSVRRVDGASLFGSWLSVTGPTVPWRGYFCAVPVEIAR